MEHSRGCGVTRPFSSKNVSIREKVETCGGLPKALPVSTFSTLIVFRALFGFREIGGKR